MFSAHAKGNHEDNQNGKPSQAFVPIENFVAAERYLQMTVNWGHCAGLEDGSLTRSDIAAIMTIPTLSKPIKDGHCHQFN